jgi:hypothetical protein
VGDFLAEAGGSIGGGATLGTFFAFCIVEFLRSLGYEVNPATYLYYGAGLGGAAGAVTLLYTA